MVCWGGGGANHWTWGKRGSWWGTRSRHLVGSANEMTVLNITMPPRATPPPWPKMFSISMQFLEIFAKSYVGGPQVGASSYGKFWIRLWLVCIQFSQTDSCITKWKVVNNSKLNAWVTIQKKISESFNRWLRREFLHPKFLHPCCLWVQKVQRKFFAKGKVGVSNHLWVSPLLKPTFQNFGNCPTVTFGVFPK